MFKVASDYVNHIVQRYASLSFCICVACAPHVIRASFPYCLGLANTRSCSGVQYFLLFLGKVPKYGFGHKADRQ